MSEKEKCKSCGQECYSCLWRNEPPSKLIVGEPPTTLRDQFAMAVLPVIIQLNQNRTDENVLQETVNISYKIADAMMEERKK